MISMKLQLKAATAADGPATITITLVGTCIWLFGTYGARAPTVTVLVANRRRRRTQKLT